MGAVFRLDSRRAGNERERGGAGSRTATENRSEEDRSKAGNHDIAMKSHHSPPQPTHVSGTLKGEEFALNRVEPGRKTRAVRSFDPCRPCGVHMDLGPGRELQQLHTPSGLMGLAR